jgi:hypothetical protein
VTDLSIQQKSSYAAYMYTKGIGAKMNIVENANIAKTPCVLSTEGYPYLGTS